MPSSRRCLAGGGIGCPGQGEATKLTIRLPQRRSVDIRDPRTYRVRTLAVRGEHAITWSVRDHPETLAADVDPVDPAEAMIAVAASTTGTIFILGFLHDCTEPFFGHAA
jgi:hypothetical protein